MRGALFGTLVFAVLLVPSAAASSAGPVAAGDPPSPAVAKASSGMVPPTAPPADDAPARRREKKLEPETPAERLEIEAKAWAVIDARTGEMLLSQAARERLPIASATKLMTAYVAMKELPLERIVRAAPYDAEFGESLLETRPGERISVRDLLYGLILLSGNDAAHTLAVRAAGSTERFVREMNRSAAALGLPDSHYANPVGLDQKGNYSSARDLLTLSRRLLQMPAFARISDTESVLLRSTQPPRRIETINELLRMEPWVTGVKTGHTWGAGYILVGSGRRDGVELISVAIAAPTDETRYSDNLALLEYGFSQYEERHPIRRGEEFADPAIRYSGGELPLRAGRAVAVGVRRGQELSVRVRAPSEVEGPVRRGAVLGRATIYVDGLRAGAVELRAGRSIPAASGFDRVRDFLGDNLLAVALAACVILMVGALLYRRLSRGKRARERIQVNAK
jgi:serine-type D-Ala-D-Ala carboxypeptidase (penicillin-binding protein 5/6)